jgi:hypothetical protein
VVYLGKVTGEPSLDQQVADLAFQVRRLEANIHNLEQHLEEALNAIRLLQQPKDVRYVRQGLRGRS